MADNDCVIISGGNAAAKLLPVLLFKVLLCGYQDIGAGIELQKFSRPLLRDMVGNHDQRLGTKPQPLHFHCRRHHLIRFPGPYFVGKQGISAIQNVRDGIDLMGPKGDLRVHSLKVNMLPVILTGADGIEGFVVDAAQALSAVNVPPYPLRKFLLDEFLPVLGNSGFLLVEDGFFIAVFILDIVEYPHILLIQGLLQDMIGSHALGAVGGEHLYVAPVRVFVRDGPLASNFGTQDFDAVPGVISRGKQFLHKLLVNVDRHPVGTDADADFPSAKICGLYRFQRLYLPASRFLLAVWGCFQKGFCHPQFPAHIP